MTNWMRNQLTRLYSAVSAPVAIAYMSVRDAVSLLYNRMVEKIGYGQERLKDIMEKEAEEKGE